jgi:proteic killer suppression protein
LPKRNFKVRQQGPAGGRYSPVIPNSAEYAAAVGWSVEGCFATARDTQCARSSVSPQHIPLMSRALPSVPLSGTVTRYRIVRMILSFRDVWLQAFFVGDARSKKIPADLESRLFRKIQMIDDATTDQDLRVPPSNHFEKLRGNLEGFHSIRVNQQWRLIFRWDGSRGEARDLYLDHHSYS